MLSPALPVVSVIVANFNGIPYLPQTLQCLLRQSHQAIEIIVSDDGSSDDSVSCVRAMSLEDGRIRLLQADRNSGPSAARNRALAAARGEWVAIVDADDLVHPKRFETLLRFAAERDADLVADDMLYFSDNKHVTPRLHLGTDCPDSFDVSLESFVWSDAGGKASASLGYLKPMIRRTVLQETRYKDGLHVGEDYELILRLLAAGARYSVLAEPLYLYRRHAHSISHRLSRARVEAIIRAQLEFEAAHAGLPAPVRKALAARLRHLKSVLRFEECVEGIKARRPTAVLSAVISDAGVAAGLLRSLREKFARRQTKQASPSPSRGTRLLLADDPEVGSVGSERLGEPGAERILDARTYVRKNSLVDRAGLLELASLASDAASLETRGETAEYLSGFIVRSPGV